MNLNANEGCKCRGNCVSGAKNKASNCKCRNTHKKCGPWCACGKGKTQCMNGKPLDNGPQTKKTKVKENYSFERIAKLSRNQLAFILGDILNKNPRIKLEKHMPEGMDAEQINPNKEVECDDNDQTGQSTSDDISSPDNQAANDQPPADPQPEPNNGNAPDWCFCTKCGDMDSPLEKECCTNRRGTGCITDHVNFRRLILDREVLRLQMNIRHDAINVRALDTNRFYRHAGYKQYIAWRIGPMGRHNRRVIPSCTVLKIRSIYPNPPGRNYKGFVAVGQPNRGPRV